MIQEITNFALGAAVEIELEKFDDAITDCDRALELKPGFAKVG